MWFQCGTHVNEFGVTLKSDLCAERADKNKLKAALGALVEAVLTEVDIERHCHDFTAKAVAAAEEVLK